jgi:L-lysine 2,3-aminomutase
LIEYLQAHKQVKDVLFTGGDPMVMPAKLLRKYISGLLDAPGLEHISSIRVGSKSLAFWPYRYTTDKDAKEVLDIFGAVTKSGRHMALQAHFSHPRELESLAVQEAIRLIRMTGAQIRCQSPLIRRVNDSAKTWQDMWNEQVRLGLIPYYMFVERDTGASSYFSVPLSRAYTIFSNAYSGLSGLARTVRGPSMSASPGKISVVGVDSIAGQMVFILKFLQARDPAWIGTTFLAKFDEHATWLDELVPAFGDSKFFYEEEYQKILDRVEEGSSGQLAR